MLMNPKKGETAVHGYHCPGDMAVRMREVLARPWVGVCVPLALNLSKKFHYYANSLCSKNLTIMLKNSHYYAQIFFSGSLIYLLIFAIGEDYCSISKR